MFGLIQSACPAIAAAARRCRSRRSASLEVPQVEVANFAERHDVHLSVGSGRRCAAMPRLKSLGEGDTIIVTRLDRLARSTRHLLNILHASAKAGATFNSLAHAG